MNSATRRRNSSSGSGTQPGWWKTESSSRCGTPRAAASAAATVVLPDPLLPTTDIRSTPLSMCAAARDRTGIIRRGAIPGLAGQAGPQRDDVPYRGPELAVVQRAVAVGIDQPVQRLDALADVLDRAEQQVHPGGRGQHGAVLDTAVVHQSAGLQRVGDGDAGVAEPLPQLALDDLGRQAGRAA